MALTRRLQILVDDERYASLEHEAARAGTSIGAVVREAIDERIAPRSSASGGAGARLLGAPAMPVGEPDELRAEIVGLSSRWPDA